MLADRLRMAATPKAPSGQQLYENSGTNWSFVVPAGVTEISVCAIGGGGFGGSPGATTSRGGGGGGLSYVNNIAVTAGETLTVTVPVAATTSTRAADTEIKRGATVLCSASAGYSGDAASNPGVGGSFVIGTGFSGGLGGLAGYGATTGGGGAARYAGGGGGGAAGYSGNGGNGAAAPNSLTNTSGSSGAGGGAAGGAAEGYTYVIGADTYYSVKGFGGGGTGIKGEGSSGTGGTGVGAGGSGGTAAVDRRGGLSYGGGSSSYQEVKGTIPWNSGGTSGTAGALRIIWGTARSYPSNAADV